MRPPEIAGGVAITAALLLGGGTHKGVASDDLVQLACLPLLACVILEYSARERWNDWARIACALILAVPALQLVPLPPVLWSMLPGRDSIVESYRSAGLELPWSSLTVSPWATKRSALALLPPITIFLAARMWGRSERRRLALLILAFGLATVAVEIVQVVQGSDGALRFYPVTSKDVGVGFFANRNHTAAFLYSTIPIAAFALRDLRWRGAANGVALWLAYTATAWLGLMMTASRSALLMGLLSTTGACALLLRGRLTLQRLRPIDLLLGAAFIVVAGVLAGSFGLLDILARLGDEKVAADARWPVARASLAAAAAFFPFGSGLGAFDRVYPLFESAGKIIPAVVNHAHDDLLELILEAGAAGVLILVSVVAAGVIVARRCLSERDPSVETERSAALLVAALLFIHSSWDYPLRTSAMAVVFAFCCGAASADRRVARKRSEGGERRRAMGLERATA